MNLNVAVNDKKKSLDPLATKPRAGKPGVSKPRGHTLVELLISMALSLGLMAGVVRAFTDSNLTFSVVVEQALMQENGRFALDFIERQVRRAGFIDEIDVVTKSDPSFMQRIFPAAASVDSSAVFTAGAVVVGLDNTTESGPFPSKVFRDGSDILHIRYQRSQGSVIFMDCNGRDIDEDFPGTNTVSLFVDKDANLVCAGVDRKVAVLVEGVEDMQIRYGIDVDRSFPVSADKYITAAEIGLNDDGLSEWRDVVALKFALLASSGPTEKSFVRGKIDQAYDVFEQTRQYSDGRIRETFEQTIKLRNRHI